MVIKGLLADFERAISTDQWATNHNGLKRRKKDRIQRALAVKTAVSFIRLLIHLFTHALIYPIDKLNKFCLCTRHCAITLMIDLTLHAAYILVNTKKELIQK